MPKVKAGNGILGMYLQHPSILDRLCYYCGEFTNGKDHRPPRGIAWAYPKSERFVVRCCMACNSKLGDKLLTVNEAKAYLEGR